MLSQQNISSATPAGAELIPGGASFRFWAPGAMAVYLNGIFGDRVYDQQTEDRLLKKDASSYWSGFQEDARDGDKYRFWVNGEGSSGYKRDPRARELEPAGFPNSFSILRETDDFPWHNSGFVTPDFSDMIVYQLHVGTFAIRKNGISSNLLDVACKVAYLADLGINVLQPLPIDEQEANPSMGYGGADLFSPDFPYVAVVDDLPSYLVTINSLLAAKQLTPFQLEDISSGPKQLMALVDVCHVYGIAVVFDVVYNHGGGFDISGRLDDNCLYYIDRVQDRQ
jgi:1,4-alpha-glucan branching enzyme